jgi:hypothetical protein
MTSIDEKDSYSTLGKQIYASFVKYYVHYVDSETA